jgi:outer membrane protein assembly factor BamA
MTRWVSQWAVILLLASLSLSRPTSAQSQGCVDSAAILRTPAQETKISIVGVEFQDGIPLSSALRTQLAADIQQQELRVTQEETDSSWIDEALNPTRDALRNQGYFIASVEGIPHLVRALPAERLYVLRVTVESGPKFNLGKMRFTNASETPLGFPDTLLRQQFHLQEGGVFDVSKIRDGLQAIRKLYGSKGYIDATAEPDTTIDEENSRIDLLIKVDEEQAYHIGKITFLGMDNQPQAELRLPQKTGDPFNPALWENFLRDNKLHLSPDESPARYMQFQKNVRDGTLFVTFDFRLCPKTEPFDE